MFCLIFNHSEKPVFEFAFARPMLFLSHFIKNSMNLVSVICKLAMRWYLMSMCASWLCPFNLFTNSWLFFLFMVLYCTSPNKERYNWSIKVQVLDSARNYYQPFCNSYVWEVETYQKIFWCFSFVNKIRIKYLQNKVKYFTLKHRRKDNPIQLTTMFLTLATNDFTHAINSHDTHYRNGNCLKTFA